LGKIEATRVLRLSPLVVRNRPEVFSPKSDLENTPVFEAGTASTLGLAANALLNDHQTMHQQQRRMECTLHGYCSIEREMEWGSATAYPSN